VFGLKNSCLQSGSEVIESQAEKIRFSKIFAGADLQGLPPSYQD
jgi:hypothetical protein